MKICWIIVYINIYTYTVNFTRWKNNWDGELVGPFAGKLNFFAQGVY